METHSQDEFLVGDWRIQPSDDQITRDNDTVRLEPKTMDVLVYLAKHPHMVSRGDLEREIWRGALVGNDAVTNTIAKLRKAFGDTVKNPSYIATIPKRGYRLVAPVVFPQVAREHRGLPTTTLPPIGRRSVLVIVFLLLVAASVYVVQNSGSSTPDIPDHKGPKTVAVLPFHNLSGDPAQDYFAEGLSDDLISSLSRFSDLKVIARDSTIHYKGTEVKPIELADKLKVKYLIQGSVRRDDERLRINVQLINSRTREILCSESFDDQVAGLFALQDEIMHRIVVALTGQMNIQDRQELSSPRTRNLQAYDHFLYGRQQFFLYANAEKNLKARESFRQAVALDPEFAIAYAMLAWTHAFDAMNGWSESRRKSLERAKALAHRAIELDVAIPVAYFVRGIAYRELGNRGRALVEAKKAIAFDPNYAGAYVLQATLLYFDGQHQEGLQLIKRAITLNPHHPYNYSFHLGQAYYLLHRYDDAIGAFNQVLMSNPAMERAHLWLAATYAQGGMQDDAEWEVEQVLTTNPELSIQRIRSSYPFTHSSDLQHFIAGLTKAGIQQ